MAHTPFQHRRRSLIVGAGAFVVASASGLWAWNVSDHTPLMDIPPGWYLLSRAGPSASERQLVALHNQGLPEHLLETEVGSTFLSAAVAPDGSSLALLKRVMRGSMPTDAVGLYDSHTFRRLAVVEVQIAFQRVPTFTIGWSADATQLAVPYDNAGRTLIFGVNAARKLSLQSMPDHAFFQFHPTRADIALYAAIPPAPNQVSIVQIVAGMQDHVIETIIGTDAQWSPDGTKLAYLDALGTNGGQRLLVRDEATRQIQVLQANVRAMAWSPDNRRLAVYGLASNDLLNIGTLLPAHIIPGWKPGVLEPHLFIYDTATAGTSTINHMRNGFQLANMQWLNQDWLLVVDVKAKQSFITDRRGEQRIPVTALDDYTPLIRWIAQA